jgi:SAM-dependent methyltransferase
VSIDTQAHDALLRQRRLWQRKPVLRRIYNEEFFARLVSSRKTAGVCIEVGGGAGFFKELLPSVFCTDLIPCPWLDAVVDAQRLPFRASSISNIFGLDMLHHLAAPMMFLSEVQRVLIPGGRLILVEPWITPLSRFIYRYLHQEDCDLSAQPWDADGSGFPRNKKAFEGNQAIPYLLFGPRTLSRTLEALKDLKVVAVEPFCLFAYLLSFGFKPMSLLPEFLYPAVSKLERQTLPVWRRLGALRVLLVLEKTPQAPGGPLNRDPALGN